MKFTDSANKNIPKTFTFEWPERDYLQGLSIGDLNNLQIHGIQNHKGRWNFNFILSNLYTRELGKECSLTDAFIKPEGSLIRQINTYSRVNDEMLAGVRFLDKDKTIILEAGDFTSRSQHNLKKFDVNEDERVIGIRAKTYEHDRALLFDI